jgi:hypothetical protein
MDNITHLEREVKRLKTLVNEGVEIAKAFRKETGMVWGERIGEFLKDAEGSHFNAREYNYEKPVGEQ